MAHPRAGGEHTHVGRRSAQPVPMPVHHDSSAALLAGATISAGRAGAACLCSRKRVCARCDCEQHNECERP